MKKNVFVMIALICLEVLVSTQTKNLVQTVLALKDKINNQTMLRVWVAISPRGLSKPVCIVLDQFILIQPSSLTNAWKKACYCSSKSMHHINSTSIFWPDLACAHYISCLER